MSDEEECNCPPEGLPAYMGTFADLMALLMCFFVLLLSFSEMDVLKFKQIAGSMNFAFGVQNKVEVKDIPKGTSIVAKEFSPGKPQPTVIQSVMQQTVDITKETVEFDEPDEDDAEGEGKGDNQGLNEQTKQGATEGNQSAEKDNTQDGESGEGGEGSGQETGHETAAEKAARLAKLQAAAEKLAKAIAQDLQAEISKGQVELLAKGAYVVIRIRERGSFRSGSDTIERNFMPVLKKIEKILKGTAGEIRVAGHTDSLPIDNEFFRSNWELSGGRAASVTRELLKSKALKKERFVINGYADTKPIADNKTAKGRATNRRVEIIIVQGEKPEGEVVGVGLKD
jgi:chemotaxis protein MotB